MYVRDAPPSHLLSIYLEDHLTGASAGRSLAHRTLLANQGTPYADGLRRLAREIEEELGDLRRIIQHHDRSRAATTSLKVMAALAAERLGRLKLNGQLRGYSPLSRVLELEGLVAGVHAKQSLWRTLQTLQDPDALPDGVDLELLARQADDQLTLLQELHDRAAAEAFRAA